MYSATPYPFTSQFEGTDVYKRQGVTGTIDEKTLVKAQAYALRALYEFNLVNLFGEPYNHNPQALGIPLRLSSGVEKDEIARNTVKEVYDQVIKDLNEAERLYMELPKNLQYRQDMRTSLPLSLIHI